MQSFQDWLASQAESSAFTRLRRDAALGLKPPIAGAAVHSRSTAHPFEVEKLGDKKKGKKRKKKGKKKGKGRKLGKKLIIIADPLMERDQTPNVSIDTWLDAVRKLKGNFDQLKELLDKKEKLPKKPKDEKPDEKDKSTKSDKEDEKPDKDKYEKEEPSLKDKKAIKSPLDDKKEEKLAKKSIPKRPEEK